MKVAQEIDVDNVTIIINSKNKLEAKLPTNSTNSVVIEEITGINGFYDDWGNQRDSIVQFGKNGQQYPITKVGRIVGTNWLVFSVEGLNFTDSSTPAPDLPPADKPTSPTDTSNAKEYLPEGEIPKVEINKTDYTYEISGSMKLKANDGTYLTGMNSDTTGKVSQILFGKYPHIYKFILLDGQYSGSVGRKQYELVSTKDGIKIQDELGVQTKSVTFNMESPDNYDNVTQHNVTVEVRDDEIVVYGSGRTTSFGDPKDSYPAFFTDLFGYISSDFNYVEVVAD